MSEPTTPDEGTEDDRVYVAVLRVAASMDAAIAQKTPFVVTGSTPALIDFDLPHVELIENTAGTPTLFASEKEARTKVDRLCARVKAIQRVAQTSGLHRDIGKALMLIPQWHGGQSVGGYEVLRWEHFLIERDEEKLLYAEHDQEKVAKAVKVAEQAQQYVSELEAVARPVPDKLRKLAEPDDSPLAGLPHLDSNWRGYGPTEPGIQIRLTQEGTKYRARVAGEVSETLSSLHAACAWRDARQEAALPA